MKHPLIVANWKLYIETPEEAKAVLLPLRRAVAKMSGCDIVVCPPAPLLQAVAASIGTSDVLLGAQALSSVSAGAHTGEVSARSLVSLGVKYVLVGHSERRALGETDLIVAAQVLAALNAGLTPVLCVGELEREVSGGHFSYISKQLSRGLALLTPTQIGKLVIAYEPVWAIGKSASDAMQPAELEEMIIFIRKILTDLAGRPAASRVQVLYGGSVEVTNAKELLTYSKAGGLLVGHASAAAATFVPLLTSLTKN